MASPAGSTRGERGPQGDTFEKDTDLQIHERRIAVAPVEREKATGYLGPALAGPW